MKEIKVVIVDDSPFSIALLRDMLTESGFNVIGEADSLSETIKVIAKLKPDIVTMDMTMPDADGFECTKAIHSIDPNIKVVVVSSLMDDELIRKAKKINISGYIQKPVDKEELSLTINRIMSNEELYSELEYIYPMIFKESFKNAFNTFTKSIPEFSADSPNAEILSRGISIVIGIIGKYSGRILFDISHDTAAKLAEHILKRKPKDSKEVLNMLSEISNIISGNACSVMNKKNKLFGFKIAPPSVFHGDSLTISKAELESVVCSTAETDFGEVYMSVGFQRRAKEWM